MKKALMLSFSALLLCVTFSTFIGNEYLLTMITPSRVPRELLPPVACVNVQAKRRQQIQDTCASYRAQNDSTVRQLRPNYFMIVDDEALFVLWLKLAVHLECQVTTICQGLNQAINCPYQCVRIGNFTKGTFFSSSQSHTDRKLLEFKSVLCFIRLLLLQSTNTYTPGDLMFQFDVDV